MDTRTHIVDGRMMALVFRDRAVRAEQSVDSFDAIIATEYPRIRRLATRFGIVESDLDDAAQEVLAKAWTKRASFGNRASVSTWITRIALNHFSTLLRRQRRRMAFFREHQESAPPARSPRAESQNKEAYELASRCIGTLSRKQRDAFVLRYLEEMSYGEVADVLGISEEAARARAFKARSALREMLREYDL